MTNGTIQENEGLGVGGEMRTVGGGSGTGGDGLMVLMSAHPDKLFFTGVITRTSDDALKELEYKDSGAAETARAANQLLDLAKKIHSGEAPVSCNLQIGLHLGDGCWQTAHCQAVEDSRSRAQIVRRLLLRLAQHLESVP